MIKGGVKIFIVKKFFDMALGRWGRVFGVKFLNRIEIRNFLEFS
jgi:hypothetical protein